MCQPPWFLDPGGWSKTAAVRLYFIFPGICTLSLDSQTSKGYPDRVPVQEANSLHSAQLTPQLEKESQLHCEKTGNAKVRYSAISAENPEAYACQQGYNVHRSKRLLHRKKRRTEKGNYRKHGGWKGFTMPIERKNSVFKRSH
ncbi:hypothetical protein STEG23_015123 [Scotinomys teguina]